MGGLQYCFEQKKSGKKDNKMMRLTSSKNNEINNLFFTKKGKIISLKSDGEKNNSDSEIKKTNTSETKDININIKKYNKKRSKNLSVDNGHTTRKNTYDTKQDVNRYN